MYFFSLVMFTLFCSILSTQNTFTDDGYPIVVSIDGRWKLAKFLSSSINSSGTEIASVRLFDGKIYSQDTMNIIKVPLSLEEHVDETCNIEQMEYFPPIKTSLRSWFDFVCLMINWPDDVLEGVCVELNHFSDITTCPEQVIRERKTRNEIFQQHQIHDHCRAHMSGENNLVDCENSLRHVFSQRSDMVDVQVDHLSSSLEILSGVVISSTIPKTIEGKSKHSKVKNEKGLSTISILRKTRIRSIETQHVQPVATLPLSIQFSSTGIALDLLSKLSVCYSLSVQLNATTLSIPMKSITCSYLVSMEQIRINSTNIMRNIQDMSYNLSIKETLSSVISHVHETYEQDHQSENISYIIDLWIEENLQKRTLDTIGNEHTFVSYPISGNSRIKYVLNEVNSNLLQFVQKAITSSSMFIQENIDFRSNVMKPNLSKNSNADTLFMNSFNENISIREIADRLANKSKEGAYGVATIHILPFNNEIVRRQGNEVNTVSVVTVPLFDIRNVFARHLLRYIEEITDGRQRSIQICIEVNLLQQKLCKHIKASYEPVMLHSLPAETYTITSWIQEVYNDEIQRITHKTYSTFIVDKAADKYYGGRPDEFLRVVPPSNSRWDACFRSSTSSIAKVQDVFTIPKYFKIFIYGMNERAGTTSSKEMSNVVWNRFPRQEWSHSDASIFNMNSGEYMYATEQIILDRLLCSPYVTHDPEKADLFFVPLMLQWYMHNSGRKLGFAGGRDRFAAIVSSIRKEFPFFNKTKGADHFFVAINDIGDCIGQWIPDAAENSIFLTHFGDKSIEGQLAAAVHLNTDWMGGDIGTSDASEMYNAPRSAQPCGYKPVNDIVIPPYPGNINALRKLFGQSFGTIPSLNRKYTGFFAGKIEHSELRKHLVSEFLNKKPQYQVLDHTLPTIAEYFQYMSNSIFCFAPPGHQEWTPRIAQAILSGCIPIIISKSNSNNANNDFPWSSATFIDYAKFSLHFTSSDVSVLHEKIQGVSADRISNMQKELLKVTQFFNWRQNSVDSSDPYEDDAFTLLLSELSKKVRNHHYKTDI